MINVNVSLSDKWNGTDTKKIKQLIKNIQFFCNTPKGSLPLMRDYGFDFTILDEPMATVKMKATVDIISGIRKYFNIQIIDIEVIPDTDGSLKIKIQI